MNVAPRIQTYCCPSCGGFIGEAAPVETVVASVMHPLGRSIVATLGSRVGKFVKRDALIDACYADDPDGGPEHADRVFGVALHRLRRQIEPFGWHIECRGGRGPHDSGGGFYRLIPTGDAR